MYHHHSLHRLFLSGQVSSAAFRAFSCEAFDDGSSYLRTDYGVECSSPEGVRARQLAWIGLGIYPCGITVIYVLLLLCARRAIHDKQPTALSKALSFVVRDYCADYYYWELLEAWKKLFLVGFAVLVTPGSIQQLVISFIVCLTFLLLTAVCRPMHDESDNIFANACNFCLTAMFFCFFILKVGTLTEAVNNLLPPQLLGLFYFSPGLLTLALFSFVIGALLVAALISASQLLIAARRPVIKLVATSAPPHAVERHKGQMWHMFLSHVVAKELGTSSSDLCETIKRQLSAFLPGAAICLSNEQLKQNVEVERTGLWRRVTTRSFSHVDPSLHFVAQSQAVMVCVATGYFLSATCLRHARDAVQRRKSISLLYDPVQAGAPVEVIKREECPADLCASLFSGRDVLVWLREPRHHTNRVADMFQQVTLKLLAEQLLRACPHADSFRLEEGLFVPDEPTHYCWAFRGMWKASRKQLAVCFSAANNPGAEAVLREVQDAPQVRGTSKPFQLVPLPAPMGLCSSSVLAIHIGRNTFTGDMGNRLAEEVSVAQAAGLRILLLHENDPAAGGCELSLCLAAAPTELKLDSMQIVALHPSPFNELSCCLVAQALGASQAGTYHPVHQPSLRRLRTSFSSKFIFDKAPARRKLRHPKSYGDDHEIGEHGIRTSSLQRPLGCGSLGINTDATVHEARPHPLNDDKIEIQQLDLVVTGTPSSAESLDESKKESKATFQQVGTTSVGDSAKDASQPLADNRRLQKSVRQARTGAADGALHTKACRAWMHQHTAITMMQAHIRGHLGRVGLANKCKDAVPEPSKNGASWAVADKEDGGAVQPMDSSEASEEGWTMEAWLSRLGGVASALASALKSGEDVPDDELTYARGLGCSAQALQIRLAKGGALEKLSSYLAKQFQELQQAEAVTAGEMHDKFALDDRSFELQLGGLDTFYGGLEGIVGPPKPQVDLGMQQDHLEMQDSFIPFDMPNRKMTTTSATEWRFVASPEEGSDGQGGPFVPYPNPNNSRQPLPFEDFAAEFAKRNVMLTKMKQPRMCREEFIGARLYTGPLYIKYNALLRGLQFKSARANFDRLCRGNKYTTTMHAINSAIIKLSKLTSAGKVYRGVSGGLLPEVCRRPNSHGIKGGVEGGFMSTTFDRSTALFYAKGGADKSKRGGPAVLFETQMGMVDRGADVSWLSEFPHEAEILFAPYAPHRTTQAYTAPTAPHIPPQPTQPLGLLHTRRPASHRTCSWCARGTD